MKSTTWLKGSVIKEEFLARLESDKKEVESMLGIGWTGYLLTLGIIFPNYWRMQRFN